MTCPTHLLCVVFAAALFDYTILKNFQKIIVLFTGSKVYYTLNTEILFAVYNIH